MWVFTCVCVCVPCICMYLWKPEAETDVSVYHSLPCLEPGSLTEPRLTDKARLAGPQAPVILLSLPPRY